MSLQAELLLLGTGLLEPPARRHVRATPALEKAITDALLDVLEREKPSPVLVVPDRVSYYDRLVKYDPKYEKTNETIGLGLGGEYQMAHQAARQKMIDQRPITEFQTLVGPQRVDNSYDQDLRYAWEAELVENHLRLAKDLAAGALIPSAVQLYATLFPEVYRLSFNAMKQGIADKITKEPEWFPALWLDSALRVFFQVPFDVVVNVAGPSAPETPPVKSQSVGTTKYKLPIQAAQTPGQGLSVQTRTPRP